MTSDNTTRKCVLFVDDDAPFLEVLQPYLEGLSGNAWEVFTATDSQGALRALAARHIDLAVLDVRMPVMDGVQLLQLLNRKYPQLKKAVLSGFVDEECRALAFNGAAELVLEKPQNPAGYEALFGALNELMQLQAEQGFRGELRRVGLEDIIQMECLSRHSLILELSARGQRGRIYIRTGALVHAECGEATGEAALHQLLALSGGEFKHLPFADPSRETLEGSWEFLLLEAVRQRDEAAGGGEVEAVPGTPPGPAMESSPVELSSAPAVGVEPEAPLINELVVCSDTGELLYETGSAGAPARCRLCMAFAGAAARLQTVLPVGALERVEFISAPGRVLARYQDSQALFIRACDS